MNENEQVYQGAAIDTRPQEAKDKDYRFEEMVASAAPVKWEEKKERDWRKFPIFDQGQSGSCVAQTGKKMLGVHAQIQGGVFLEFSAAHIYKRRVNAPGGGMIADDCFQIMKNKGTTLAAYGDPQKVRDTVMDATIFNPFAEKVGEAFRIGNYFSITSARTIDTIASIIQETGKAVMIWMYFNHDEWGEVPAVKRQIDLYAASTSRHSVAAVDFTLYKGKKALIIDDSWGPNAGNGAGQRIITEDFFNARCYYAGHFQNLRFEDQSQNDNNGGTVPSNLRYTFSRDLEYIPSAPVVYNQPDVVALQDCLRHEGAFPVNSKSTGYFGPVTKASVGRFQEKYKIASPKDAGYGRCGPKTRAKLNQLFGK